MFPGDATSPTPSFGLWDEIEVRVKRGETSICLRGGDVKITRGRES